MGYTRLWGRLSTPAYYIAVFVAPFPFLWLLLELSNHPLHVPVFFSNDTFIQCLYIKPVLEGEWPSHITRLGAPFYHNAYLFPQNSTLDYCLAWCVGFATGDFGSGLNIAWLIKVMLSAVAATWSLRRLRLSPPVALLGGVLYSMLPFTFARNVWHYNLSLHTAPIICAMLVLLLENRFKDLRKRNKFLFLGACVLLGFNDPYAAFFSCMLLALCLVPLILSTARRRALILCAALALIIAAGAVNAIPSLLAYKQNPVAAKSFRASREELEVVPVYCMRVCDLVLPTPFHPVPALAEVRRLVTAKNTMRAVPYQEYSTLGAFGAFGFLVLLASVWLAIARGLPPSIETFIRRFRSPAALTVLVLLIATVYGFSSIIATFVTASFRCYDRLVVFVAFFSFYAACVVLEAAGHKLGVDASVKRKMCWYVLLFGVLLPFGVMDQKGDGPLLIMPKTVEKVDLRIGEKLSVGFHDEAKHLATVVEDRLPPGSMVYQKGCPKGYTFDQMLPYLLSREVRWSYAPRHRVDPARRWKSWFDLEMMRCPGLLLLAGFDGIWLDRKGEHMPEDDDEELDKYLANVDEEEKRRKRFVDEQWDSVFLEDVLALPRAEMVESPRRRYVFVDLARAREDLIERIGREKYEEARHAVLGGEAPGNLVAILERLGLN